MKKVFCVVLAVLLLFTMQIPAMAHGENIWESQADFAENSALVKAEDLMGFSFDRTSVTAESVPHSPSTPSEQLVTLILTQIKTTIKNP